MALPQVAVGRGGLQIWRIAAIILLCSRVQPTRGGPPAWGFGEVLTTPHRKIPACYEMLHRASELEGCCEHGNEPLGSVKGGEFLD
jgi:hypothetical protein